MMNHKGHEDHKDQSWCSWCALWFLRGGKGHADWNLNRATSALGNLRHRDAQFAVDQGRTRTRCIPGCSKANDAGKAAEAAFDEVKGGFDSGARRRLFA